MCVRVRVRVCVHGYNCTCAGGVCGAHVRMRVHTNSPPTHRSNPTRPRTRPRPDPDLGGVVSIGPRPKFAVSCFVITVAVSATTPGCGWRRSIGLN